MPPSNALIQATPRNAMLGRLSDALASTYSPERTQQAQQLAQFLSVPAVSRTLDRLSYGEPLTTGAGGLGGTTRFNNDALESVIAIAPMVGPAARVFNNSALAVGRAGERLAEKVVPQIMERGGMGAEMLGAMGNRTISPLDVYHGTPHRFPATARNPLGEFDASKIGSGEGAQVYGHGIYMAEAPAVARGYADRLGANYISVDGKPMDFNDPVHIAASIISDPNNAGLPGKQLASAIRYDPKGIVPFGAESKVEEIAKALESGNLPKFTNQKGNFYKIDLPDEKIAKMLDFDKPLSQQPEILSALTPESMGLTLRELPDGGFMSYVGSNGKPIGMQMKGATPEKFRQNWINRLKEMGDLEGGAGRAIGYLGGTSSSSDLAPAVSEALRKAGIPGIKYLDEGSRVQPIIRGGDPAFVYAANNFKDSGYSLDDAFEGMKKAYKNASAQDLKNALGQVYEVMPAQTRNFVVFPGEEKSMTILERNGQKFDNSALMK